MELKCPYSYAYTYAYALTGDHNMCQFDYIYIYIYVIIHVFAGHKYLRCLSKIAFQFKMLVLRRVSVCIYILYCWWNDS